MYVHGKMITVETIPGRQERGIKENGDKFKYSMFDIL
jgi:hypothetical protein